MTDNFILWPNLLSSLGQLYTKNGWPAIRFNEESVILSFLYSNNLIRDAIDQWYKKHLKGKNSKNDETSQLLNKKGNYQFMNKNYDECINTFTKSAQYATANNSDLSAIYAKRSDALFRLGRYNDCLKDIELVIQLGCTERILFKLNSCAIECYNKLKKNDLLNEAVSKYLESIKKSNKNTIEEQMSRLTLGLAEANNAEDSKISLNLKLEENPNFMSASVAVDKKYSPEKGRHVVANRFIKKGEILFYEKPASFVLIPQINKKDVPDYNCLHCLKSCGDIPVPCTSCTTTFYCGFKCLKESWSSYHRWLCPGSQIDLWKELGVDNLALRLCLVCATTTDRKTFNSLLTLNTNFDAHSRNVLTFAFAAMAHTRYLFNYTDFFQVNDLKECFVNKFYDKSSNLNWTDISTDDNKQIYVGSLILRLMLQSLTNAHVITRPKPSLFDECMSSQYYSYDINWSDCIASAIYVAASMMNHSCDPNTSRIFLDDQLVVKASRNIKAGEEIFNCYGFHYRKLSREKRQVGLKLQFNFECKCKPCVQPEFKYFLQRFFAIKCPICNGAFCIGEGLFICADCGNLKGPPKSYIKGMQEKIAEVFNESEKLIYTRKNTSTLEVLERRLCIEKVFWYELHEGFVRTLQGLGKISMKMGQWLTALSYFEEELSLVTVRYGSLSNEYIYALKLCILACSGYLKQEANTQNREISEKKEEYLKQFEELESFYCVPQTFRALLNCKK